MSTDPPTPAKRSRRSRPPAARAGKAKVGRISVIFTGWSEATGEWEPESPAGRFLAAMRVGNFMNDAAEWAGIGERTAYDWLARGREHAPADGDRMAVAVEHRPYFDFLQNLTKAESHAIVEMITIWRSHMKDDFRAVRDFLRLRHGAKFKEHSATEHSGPGGGPIPVENVSDGDLARRIASDPDARRLASELLAMVTPTAPPGTHGNPVPPQDDDIAGP